MKSFIEKTVGSVKKKKLTDAQLEELCDQILKLKADLSPTRKQLNSLLANEKIDDPLMMLALGLIEGGNIRWHEEGNHPVDYSLAHLKSVVDERGANYTDIVSFLASDKEHRDKILLPKKCTYTGSSGPGPDMVFFLGNSYFFPDIDFRNYVIFVSFHENSDPYAKGARMTGLLKRGFMLERKINRALKKTAVENIFGTSFKHEIRDPVPDFCKTPEYKKKVKRRGLVWDVVKAKKMRVIRLHMFLPALPEKYVCSGKKVEAENMPKGWKPGAIRRVPSLSPDLKNVDIFNYDLGDYTSLKKMLPREVYSRFMETFIEKENYESIKFI